MKFRTEIIIRDAGLQISHQDKILMMGSCFVENLSSKALLSGFTVETNPFGIVYNPISIADGLSDLINNRIYSDKDLFLHRGLYHSFSHHSCFSGTDIEAVLNNINSSRTNFSNFLQQTNLLIITFGTANTYRLLSSGAIVANCHKLPAKYFKEERLTVNQITEQWNSLIKTIRVKNPQLKILFTVSPVRHWKDGAHENQINKSILLLTVNELVNTNAFCYYFPSYEIMMDDLRDYRFYAEDMIHPNSQAIDYIWDKFSPAYFDKTTLELIKEWKSIQQALNHRPFHPESDEYKRFLEKTEKRKQTFWKLKNIKEQG
ncbi:MAG: GSCFA domain-containing protein [Dysgonamonadaceae bacterium]|jgi:predicted HNH restriction endonuclease|nr:GSCFA domain-containing protein [Dysgonamonadaceae bacterium]